MQIQNEIKKSTKIIKEKNSFFSIMLNKIITIFSNETAELKASHPFTIFFNIWPYKMCVEVPATNKHSNQFYCYMSKEQFGGKFSLFQRNSICKK